MPVAENILFLPNEKSFPATSERSLIHFCTMLRSKENQGSECCNRRNAWTILFCCVVLSWFNSEILKPWRTLGSDQIQSKIGRTQVPKFPKIVHEIGWWTPHVESTARTFEPWNGPRYSWCHPTSAANIRLPPNATPKGLLYIKSPKTSSSTNVGINLNIAHHVARRLQQELGTTGDGTDSGFSQCHHHDAHAFAEHNSYITRNRNESLLWTFVRHPRSRDISHLYFRDVSQLGVNPNDTETLLDALAARQALQSRYIDAGPQIGKLELGRIMRNPQEIVTNLGERIFDKYDFIGVLERRLESLAVMTLLWDLDPTDVIALSAKFAGSYYAFPAIRRCVKLQTAAYVHPKIKEYLNSSDYLDGNADFLLYYAADVSLDRTIEALGPQRVQEIAQLIDQLEQLANRECGDKVIFQCTPDGILNRKNDCVFQDLGCGLECVDEVMEGLRQGTLFLDG